MAAVEVFVDDAVRGHLPAVCAKTGERADGRWRVERFVGGGLGAAWLLLFLGPLGWIVLLLVSLTSKHEVLTVRLPYSTFAADHERRLVLTRRVAIFSAIGFALLLGLQVVPLLAPLWAIATVAGCAATVVAQVRLALWRVRVRLDASRRWVTLDNVHPLFAEALAHQANSV